VKHLHENAEELFLADNFVSKPNGELENFHQTPIPLEMVINILETYNGVQ
jgi:hypothetical protein